MAETHIGRGRAVFFRKVTELSQSTESPSIISTNVTSPTASTEGVSSEKLTDVPKPKGRADFIRALCSIGDRGSSVISKVGDKDAKEEFIDSGVTSSSRSSSASSNSNIAIHCVPSFKSQTRTSSTSSDISPALQSLSIETNSAASSEESITSEKKPAVTQQGISGQKIEVACNYIRLERTNNDKGIYEYAVVFDPDVDHKMMRLKLVNKHFLNIGGNVKVYDAGFRLFTPYRTKENVTSGTYEVISGNPVTVTFKYKCVKKYSDCCQILNIIMKRIMGELQLVKFGRSDYDPKRVYTIPAHKLEVWPGYITAIDEYEGGIFLNCDISHRVLQSRTIFSIIMDIANMQRARLDDSKFGNSSFQNDLSKALIGLSVITRYNNRIVKIDDIDFKKCPKDTFTKNGREISYVEYYKTQYNLDIKELGQPLLVNRVTRKPMGKENEDIINYYVPELCCPTGLTDNQLSNFKLMRDVAEITRLTPKQRDEALKTFLKSIHENENCKKILNDWGLKLSGTTTELTARTLEPEYIYFGKNRSVQERNADWGRALSQNEPLSCVHLDKWAIVYPSKDTKIATRFYEKVRQLARRMGLYVEEPMHKRINNDNIQKYCEAIRDVKNVQMVVIIVPSQREDRYATIKKLCNIELGVASQVILSRTLQKDDRSIAPVVSKILWQINCKMGGALWGVLIPHKEDGVMFLGIDAYHEGRQRVRSVIAMVASINLTATRWTSGTTLHNKGQEISDMITKLFSDCMKQWHAVNGCYPKRIIMYRDGVGDGQLRTVQEFEIPQLKKVFSQIQRDYTPKLTYVIVQKRINTRFYMKKGRSFENPYPGTIVDHTITRRDWYDFFLVSQNVRHGTVAPTHYVVIEDSSGVTADLIQKITYKMTHLYFNWNGTVRVPAPCLYAHKLAYLVGQFTHAPAANNLRNTLYFL